MLDSTELIRELVAVPGPPGREEPVREAVERQAVALGCATRVDAKGNLLIALPGAEMPARPRVVVTAHLDELGLMVTRLQPDGTVRVQPMGGVHPWKWGEQPVQILTRDEPTDAVLSFGSIHSSHPASVAEQARERALRWDQAYLFTGLSQYELMDRGVRAGVRVALHPDRRAVRRLGRYLSSYFLDDRADIAAMLLAIEMLAGEDELREEVVFAATVAEEVGGQGALYLLHDLRPEICVALEIGPSVPESPFMPGPEPTIWVSDSFASITAQDMAMLEDCSREIDLRPHWQPLSRGGSDASIAASAGAAARGVTLGLALENSHGLEIMHHRAPENLARLLVAYLRRALGLTTAVQDDPPAVEEESHGQQ